MVKYMTERGKAIKNESKDKLDEVNDIIKNIINDESSRMELCSPCTAFVIF